MRIALAQINSYLGAFSENREKILEYCHRAKERRCQVVVFPEAALFGYHPVDLLERPSIVEAQLKELAKLEKQIPEKLVVVVGAITKNPKPNGKPYYNSAVVLQKGRKQRVFAKELLPAYDVFDESRHIEKGDMANNVIKIGGKNVMITICEDIWAWPVDNKFSRYKANPLLKVKPSQVDFVINLSASPFTDKKVAQRKKVTRATAGYYKAPMVYVNLVGAQDEIVFDGGSFALDKNGKIVAQCLQFEEDLNVIDYDTLEGGHREKMDNIQEQRRQALVLGIRDFSKKTGFTKVHLGLSGGIDSSLVACLAVDALGPFNVVGISMPGPYNSPKSYDYAKELAKNLGIKFHALPIEGVYKEAVTTMDKEFGEEDFGLMHENLQSRTRCLMLMAYANRTNSLLLNCGNKSEFATGYTTIYGDQAGGISPIGDLLKSEVYELAEHYNQQGELIPKGVIERAPSAELRPDQKDSDSLPPYDVLDKMIENMVEKVRAPKTADAKRILVMMMKSEFKRWQAPPIIKVSDHGFGRGRRLPLAHRAYF